MRMTLEEIVQITGGRKSRPAEAAIDSWCIDTRTLAAGALYIALRGERADGHDFVEAARQKNAAAVLVSREVDAGDLVCLQVWDTLVALQELSRQARMRLKGTVVGVTGSAGKTTTKDTIATLLGGTLRVGKNEGNLNNHIGLPLSLLRQDPGQDVYVLEMGMNHAGEIRFLASLCRPQIAVVTNVGTAHIENFSAPEAIALAKRELVESLPPDGVAVLNADDPQVARFGAIHPGRTVTFGIEQEADFRAELLSMTAEGCRFRIAGQVYETPMVGRHNVLNETAAVAVGSLLGVSPAQMAERARELKPGRMRGERIDYRGMTILNDVYNSNPDAAKAMLDYALALPATRRIAVMGEMLELGDWSEALHSEVGCHAAALGYDIVIGIKGAAASLAAAARRGGAQAHFYATPEEAGDALVGMAKPGDVLLFKGSRGTRVEHALQRFVAG